MKPEVTIVLPVYNQRLDYLREAIDSVTAQTDSRWHLVIADNHSKDEVWDWIVANAPAGRTTLMRQERNLGVFGNLNAAVAAAKTSWCLILCSDDRLKPTAVGDVLSLSDRFPGTELVLARAESIDTEGRPLESLQEAHWRLFMSETRPFEPDEFMELMLRWGTVAGNITGMAFTRHLFEAAGPFGENWKHAGDWEWLVRAGRAGIALLSLSPIAVVRSHDDQLSTQNGRVGLTAPEVGAVLKILLADRHLATHPRARAWAAHHLQQGLWDSFRQYLPRGQFTAARLSALPAIEIVGLPAVLKALVRFLPTRVAWKLGPRRGGAPPP